MSGETFHAVAQGQILIALVLVLGVTTACIFILRPIAIRTGWVDRPSDRKRHSGDIPLTGGASILLGLSAGMFYLAPIASSFVVVLFTTTAIMALVGLIDDRFDISARFRMLTQFVLVLVVIKWTGIYVHTLGTYFGHQLTLGWLGVPFTAIAVTGLINAFNMMDGLDGLCASMGLVAIASVVFLNGVGPLTITLVLACMLGVGLVPYLAFNLGIFGRRHKIFMGDAGSMALGFIVAWTLIYTSQHSASPVKPVTVLWLIAIPAADSVAVMLCRLAEGKSPLSPGREHIHHVLRDAAGLGRSTTVLALTVAAMALVLVGWLLEKIEPAVSLLVFALMLVAYVVVRLILVMRIGQKPAMVPHVIDAVANFAASTSNIAMRERAVDNFESRHASATDRRRA